MNRLGTTSLKGFSFHFQLLLKHLVSCLGWFFFMTFWFTPSRGTHYFYKNAMTCQLFPGKEVFTVQTVKEAMKNTFIFSCSVMQGHLHKELVIMYQLQICNRNKKKRTREKIWSSRQQKTLLKPSIAAQVIILAYFYFLCSKPNIGPLSACISPAVRQFGIAGKAKEVTSL